MTPEERLRAALTELTSRTHPASDALARVRDRAHRRRRTVQLRAVTGVATASLLVAAVPIALRASESGRPLRPIATPTGSASPAPGPTASSPMPSASPPPAAAGPGEFAAVTDDADLVLVSAATGRKTRTIGRLESVPGSLDLAPDGRTIYLDIFPDVSGDGPPPPELCPTVYAIDVADGTWRAVTRGYSPTLSPDGSRLAVATCPEPGVRIVGGKTYPYGPNRTVDGPGNIASIAWTTDGRGIYVQHGGDDSNAMTRLDLATAREADQGEIVDVQTLGSNTAVPWRDGMLLTTEHHPWELGERYAVSAFSRTATSESPGDHEVLFRLPESSKTYDDVAITYVVAGPDGQILVQTEHLYRWDGSGEPVRLGPAYARIGW